MPLKNYNKHKYTSSSYALYYALSGDKHITDTIHQSVTKVAVR